MSSRKYVAKSEPLVAAEPLAGPLGAHLDRRGVGLGDELDDEERAELHAAIDEGLVELRSGGGVDADELLAALRARG